MLIIFSSLFVEGILFNILKGSVNNDLLAVLFIFFNAVIFFYVFVKSTNHRIFVILLFVAYFLRIALMFFDIYGNDIFLLPHSGSDSYHYHILGIEVSERLWSIGQVEKGNYTIFLGVLYKIFGPNRIVSQYVNVVFGMCIPLLLLKISKLIKIDNKKLTIPFIITCFFPQFLFFSAILLRESIMIFFIALSLYYLIKWYLSEKFIFFIYSISAILVASIFHAGILFIGLIYIMFIALFDAKQRKLRLSPKAIISLMASVVIVVLLNVFFREVFFEKFIRFENGFLRVVLNTLNNTRGESVYLANLQFNNLFDVVLYFIPKTIYYLFSPMPWDWRNIADAISFILDSTIYLYLFYKIIAG